MRRAFKDLSIGQQFYVYNRAGKIDLRWVFMKINAVVLSNPEPSKTFKIAQAVVDNGGHINTVVVTSPIGSAGTFDHFSDDTVVCIAPDYVC